jgi:hypothetical protein
MQMFDNIKNVNLTDARERILNLQEDPNAAD